MEQNDMTKMQDALADLRSNQAAVEEAVKSFSQQDLPKENAQLREKVEHLNIQLKESSDEINKLHQKYEALNKNFKHEMSSKRIALLGLSERQHHKYLKAGLASEQKKLDDMYAQMKQTMSNISIQLSALDKDERAPLLEETNDLRRRVNEQIHESQKRKEAAWQDAANRQSTAINDIKSSPIENAALGAVRQFFAWETFLGLKIISAIGALMLLLGVFTFGRYLYSVMGATLQCVSIFVIGALLMAAGEVFHRKKWRGSFTLALTAIGSGVLFLGAALGYITLGVLPVWAALTICVLVSLLTFAASLRYDSQFIAVFALIGGYLPLIVITEEFAIFGAIYFITLSLLNLLIATRKNWRIARFVGLGATLIAQAVLIAVTIDNVVSTGVVPILGASIAIGYIAYLVIPVFGAWFTKTRIKAADIVLLSCNVVLSYSIALFWGAVYAPNIIPALDNHTQAILALVSGFFALSCVVMAVFTERQQHSGVPKSQTGSLRALLFITSISFSTLIVLFAFDRAWLSAGWLVQATGLALYGIVKKRHHFNVASIVIGVLCLMSFLIFNVPNYEDPIFVWQYLLITLTAVAVSTAALKSKPQRRTVRIYLDIFRFTAILNLWLYVVYLLHTPLMPTLERLLANNSNQFAALIAITFGYALAFSLPRIKRVYNYGFQLAASAVGAISSFWLISFNAAAGDMTKWNIAMSVVTFVLYVIVNLIAVGWINDLLQFMIKLNKLPLSWYTLLITGSTVLLVVQNLVVQLSLSMSSLILTLIFGVTALGWIVYGFVKRNNQTRIGGLAMTFFAVIKLFVIDLHNLNSTWRIVSYFIAGIILLTISFTYQWFSKKLNINKTAANDTPVPADEEQML